MLGPAALVALACEHPPNNCLDVTSLSQDDANLRKTLGYVDKAPDPEKACAHCRHYVAAPKVSECGTCKLLKGPINPGGTCQAFAPL